MLPLYPLTLHDNKKLFDEPTGSNKSTFNVAYTSDVSAFAKSEDKYKYRNDLVNFVLLRAKCRKE